MSVIEVLLRLGCAMVAWMVIYTHLIWMTTIRTVGCASDGDEIWRLLLVFAPFTFGASYLLAASKKLIEVHMIFRWFGVPLVVLWPLAVMTVWPTFVAATLGSAGICDPEQIPAWHVWWAPTQGITLGIVLLNVIRARSMSNPQ